MLLDLQGMRTALLHGFPEAVEGAHSGVSAPGEDELVSASHPDHLIVDEIRGHPDQGQISPPLPDDLVRSGGWDQVRETFLGPPNPRP